MKIFAYGSRDYDRPGTEAFAALLKPVDGGPVEVQITPGMEDILALWNLVDGPGSKLVLASADPGQFYELLGDKTNLYGPLVFTLPDIPLKDDPIEIFNLALGAANGLDDEAALDEFYSSMATPAQLDFAEALIRIRSGQG